MTSPPPEQPEIEALPGRRSGPWLLVVAVAALAGAAGAWFGLRPDGESTADPTDVRPGDPIVESTETWPKPSAGAFTDIAKSAGLDFVHVSGAFGKKYFPEIMGGGCAFLDYDGDGAQDILMVNGQYWKPWHRMAGDPRPMTALYRNDGTGRYEDVSFATGANVAFFGLGVAVGDVDGDADPDVLITGIGGNRFLRNEGGRFEDVTDAVGLAGNADDYNTSAGFFDADGDGDLDLFVCNYVLWSQHIDDELDFRLPRVGRAYAPPGMYAPRHCYLYRNDGDGTFTDVSKEAGIRLEDAEGKPLAKALALALADVDADGDIDIFVANDVVRNFLFVNRGDGVFDEIGERAGVAYGPQGKPTGTMGSDIADLHNDGALAIAVGNFAAEDNCLYVRRGEGIHFFDRARHQGVGLETRPYITFGLFFFDYDLDGYLDMFQTNGGLEEKGELLTPPLTLFEPSQFFFNVSSEGGRRLKEIEPERAGDLGTLVVGRGAAYADIDADGDLDVLVAQIGGPAVLFRNDQQTGHHWLRVRLVGRGMNTEAIGAWIELEAGGLVQRRQVMPTRSYMSQVELPVTFGLGTGTQVDSLRVTWPDGTAQDVAVDGVDRSIVVRRAP